MAPIPILMMTHDISDEDNMVDTDFDNIIVPASNEAFDDALEYNFDLGFDLYLSDFSEESLT